QSNNANGRNLLKAEILAYHEQLMKMEAIENFTAEDITVEKGVEKQDVVVYENVQPVDAMEKLYMKVEVA
ncbi:MAG: phage tail sheath C-terminal domain-containing protein, partial [Anaerotignum sp.]